MNTLSRSVIAAAIFALLTTVVPSEATAVRVGTTTAAIAASVRGNAVSYDPINHVYLVVGGAGIVYGRFVDRNGNALGAQFVIQTNPALFAAFPRVTYAPDANSGNGGFLVNWSSSDTATAAFLHGRMVAFGQNGAYGAETVISTDGTWWEEATYGAYSTVNHEFLLVYRTNGTYVLRGVRVDINANPITPPFTISQTNNFENNPSVAYSPTTNQFLACWTMFTASNTGLLDCRFVQSGTGALAAGPIQVQATGSVWFTDTTYNPNTNQFLVTWDEAHGSATLGRIVNTDGSMPGGVIAVSRFFAAYDGTATAYNPVTHSFFVIAYDLTGDLTQDGGVELTDAGQPVDNGFQVTAGCLPNVKCASYYPQIAASTEDPFWMVTTAQSFQDAAYQMLQGQAVSGAPAPTPPTNTPPSPPVTPRPMLAVDTPVNNATVSTNGFMVAGWAADAGAAAGTGVDAVVAWAYPASGGSAILAGIATYGYTRPDVASAIGSQFAATGYGMVATLPTGTYTLYVYAHSTVSGLWNPPTARTVTVIPPPTHPLMFLDLPVQNQTLSQNIVVAGWAVDTAAASGPGVDAIDIYAFPTSGGGAILLGVTGTGGSRPDVAAALGSAQFATSGFSFSGTLAPGSYTIVAYAHSVIGGFNDAVGVAVTVR